MVLFSFVMERSALCVVLDKPMFSIRVICARRCFTFSCCCNKCKNVFLLFHCFLIYFALSHAFYAVNHSGCAIQSLCKLMHKRTRTDPANSRQSYHSFREVACIHRNISRVRLANYKLFNTKKKCFTVLK